MVRWLPIPVAVALLLGTGIAYGLRNNRWYTSTEIAQMSQRLPAIPLVIGDWVGTDDDNPRMTQRLKKRGTIAEMVSRVYRNTKTGEVITLLVATGRPGPISTHTPQTCIGDNNAWNRVSPEKLVPIELDPQTGKPTAADAKTSSEPIFATCKFARANSAVPQAITIYWSWHSNEKGWIAVDDPRVTFGSYMALTKIYVTQDSTSELFSGSQDAATRFISECLPEINTILFGPAPTQAAQPETQPAPPAAAA